MSRFLSVFANLICMVFLLTNARVEAVEYDVSGFMSVGAGRINTADTKFEDYDNHISFDLDTVLAAQLDLRLTHKISVTTQVTSKGYRGNGDTEYKPQFEWAYLTYQMNTAWKFRVGKMAVPYYMISDFIDVGMAYPWVRPPIDVYPYFVLPIATHEGIEFLYNKKFVAFNFVLQGIYGEFENSIMADTLTYRMKGDPVKGFNVSFSNDIYTLRYSYLDLRLSFKSPQFNQLLDAYYGLGERYPEFNDIADAFDTGKESNKFQSVGVSADYDTWLMSAEIVEDRTKNNLSADLQGYYISVAYQFERFTPYLVLGGSTSENGRQLPDLIRASDSLPITGIDKLIVNTVNELGLYAAITSAHERTQTFGVRYDISDTAVIKFEVERFDFYHGDNGGFKTIAGRETPSIVWLYGLALDLVF